MTIRYCTPEWLEESARLYRASDRFENELRRVTAKVFFRITAEPEWAIDEDILFGVELDQGKLLDLGYCSETEARERADFILGTSPQQWKTLLRKEKKFITEFLMGRVSLEEGSKAALLKITPYANHLVDALTQFEIQYPDEMSAEELSAYKTELGEHREKLGY